LIGDLSLQEVPVGPLRGETATTTDIIIVDEREEITEVEEGREIEEVIGRGGGKMIIIMMILTWMSPTPSEEGDLEVDLESHFAASGYWC